MSKIEVNFQFNNKYEKIIFINENEEKISEDFIISNIYEQLISDEKNREKWDINPVNFSKDDLIYEYIKFKDKKNHNAWVLFKEDQILNDSLLKVISIGDRIIYTNKTYDITFIQIYQDKDKLTNI